MLEKKRYVQFQLERAQPASAEEAKHLVYEALFDWLGQQGAAQAGTQFKAFDEKTQQGIVKCKPKAVELVIAALAAKRFYRKESVALRTLRVSGAIGKLT